MSYYIMQVSGLTRCINNMEKKMEYLKTSVTSWIITTNCSTTYGRCLLQWRD